MANPVRLYVIHHPANPAGKRMCEHIYEWFRMPTLEGIPVYVRSDPRKASAGRAISRRAAPKPMPSSLHDPRLCDLPYGLLEGKPKVLEYLVPLIDAHMVRDMAWRDYLLYLARHSLSPVGSKRTPFAGCVLFPVAMDGTAFNLPDEITSKNFIRHQPFGGDPEGETEAVEETLKFLTEVLARDLNARVFPQQAGEKLQIFLSYARADGADTPKRLRAYIDGQTQCTAFLDENDIAFSSDFERTLSANVGERARALIVVRGDRYADRPWCRWELDRFTRARSISLKSVKGRRREIHVFHPALVVETTEGHEMTRMLPELSQLPTIRWKEGRERRCFSMLMREVFFGARNVLAARSARVATANDLIVNRIPGPLVLHELASSLGAKHPTVYYPGNGLPLIELQLLRKKFSGLRFAAFSDIEDQLPKRMRKGLSARRGETSPAEGPRLAIVISAGISQGLASRGYLPEHQRELLIYLLRPLIRLGFDVIYGGRAPTRAAPGSADWRWNHTNTILDLLKDEQQYHDGSVTPRPASPGRLFNFSAWPQYLEMTPLDEASWIGVCSVVRYRPEDAVSRPPPPRLPTPDGQARWLAMQALVIGKARAQVAAGFHCEVPGNLNRLVVPTAFVGFGGKTAHFHGIMPGIFEEFLYSIQNGRPTYLIGGLGGAAGILARALLDRAPKRGRRPPELECEFYNGSAAGPERQQIIRGLQMVAQEDPTIAIDAARRFDELGRVVQEVRESDFKSLRNGLNKEENRRLLGEVDTSEAVQLIWHGLDRVLARRRPPA